MKRLFIIVVIVRLEIVLSQSGGTPGGYFPPCCAEVIKLITASVKPFCSNPPPCLNTTNEQNCYVEMYGGFSQPTIDQFKRGCIDKPDCDPKKVLKLQAAVKECVKKYKTLWFPEDCVYLINTNKDWLVAENSKNFEFKSCVEDSLGHDTSQHIRYVCQEESATAMNQLRDACFTHYPYKNLKD